MKFKEIEIIMFPAKSGDCILIRYLKEGFNVLIDGGFSCTYNQYLKPYLLKIAKNGARLNLIIVTHIDRDHINGIKQFLMDNGAANNPKIIRVDEIWFNGFRNMPIEGKTDNTEIPFSELGHLHNMASANSESDDDTTENISHRDGNCLADILVENGYAWNSSFSKAVAVDDKAHVEYENIHIEILNPLMEDLNNLAENWIGELKRKCRSIVIGSNHLFDRAFEGCFLYDNEYESYTETISYHRNGKIIDWKKEADKEDDPRDKSIQNLSSIAVLFKYKEMTLLFPGDCPIYKIKDKLPKKLTVVKLPHHGSGKSNEKDFIRGHEVEYYLISTDGSYGHPSKKVVGNIVVYADGSPKMIMNYHIPLLDGISIMREELLSNE